LHPGEGAPRWLVVRNSSGPRTNGALPTRPGPDVEAMRAACDEETYGSWTSVGGAIAGGAIVAGDDHRSRHAPTPVTAGSA
jgi:hypothetical protein